MFLAAAAAAGISKAEEEIVNIFNSTKSCWIYFECERENIFIGNFENEKKKSFASIGN